LSLFCKRMNRRSGPSSCLKLEADIAEDDARWVLNGCASPSVVLPRLPQVSNFHSFLTLLETGCLYLLRVSRFCLSVLLRIICATPVDKVGASREKVKTNRRERGRSTMSLGAGQDGSLTNDSSCKSNARGAGLETLKASQQKMDDLSPTLAFSQTARALS
jgi:hypothetical protein